MVKIYEAWEALVEKKSSPRIGVAGWSIVGSQWWQFNMYNCFCSFKWKQVDSAVLFTGRDKNAFDVAS